MFEWINFIFFVVSMIAWSWLYLESLQPMKKREKPGDNAWKHCENLEIVKKQRSIISIIIEKEKILEIVESTL